MCVITSRQKQLLLFSSRDFRLITSGGYIELGACLYKQLNTDEAGH